MILDLDDLEDSQRSFDLKLEPGEVELETEEVDIRREISVSGNVTKGAVQTAVAGNILAEIRVDCSRCLEKVDISQEIPFEVSFVTDTDFSLDKETEISDEDLNISVLEDEKIDFSELVREQILLALPSQVLCRDDCKGLCRICGGSKNLVNCKCEEEETDPRWAALRELK